MTKKTKEMSAKTPMSVKLSRQLKSGINVEINNIDVRELDVYISLLETYEKDKAKDLKKVAPKTRKDNRASDKQYNYAKSLGIRCQRDIHWAKLSQLIKEAKGE